MSDSSGSSAVRKPRESSLWIHKGNKSTPARWAKRVRGKVHYFGNLQSDPDGQRALNAWLDQRDDLLAGRTPRVKGGELTVAGLCNAFLEAKQHLRDSGEIAPRTWSEYKLTTDRLVGQFGKERLVSDLATADFEALRASIAKTRAAVALGTEIQRIRVVFKYGYEAGLMDMPMRFGPTFKRPTKKTLRKERNEQGERLIEAADIRKLLSKASVPLKAMILLGINCGFGNADCGQLPVSAVDLERGWVTFPRPKTAIERRCPLWPETIEALKEVLAKRKPPKRPAHANLLFVTKRGGSFAKDTPDNPVAKEFAKLRNDMGLTSGSFYHLRHTFRTIADGTRDQVAANYIMGHSDPTMAAVYRERIDDSRLRAVVEHVRTWLFLAFQECSHTNNSSVTVTAGTADMHSQPVVSYNDSQVLVSLSF